MSFCLKTNSTRLPSTLDFSFYGQLSFLFTNFLYIFLYILYVDVFIYCVVSDEKPILESDDDNRYVKIINDIKSDPALSVVGKKVLF